MAHIRTRKPYGKLVAEKSRCSSLVIKWLFLLVGGSYQFILGRQEELAMHLKEEAARRQRHSTSPGPAAGPEEISAMLIGVKGKTFSQKLEAVHDGAIETHKIGFPDSRHART